MTNRLRASIRRFAISERATLSVEAVIILPILFWAYAAMLVFWDTYRSEMLATRTTYTIGDILSRSETVDTAELTRMNGLYASLSGAREGAQTRISLVRAELAADGETVETQLRWSHGMDGAPAHTNMSGLDSRLPEMVAGDQMIIVETFQYYRPFFNIGLTDRTISRFSFTRPRAAQLLCSDCSGV
ncbi:hypothetical protein LX81_03060 [Palleronia aestuarii]|uniref:Flp pilus assembly protein TadG n=1 Tax=Palleronia aestuarii TaxID=568105 RepID=A0A2W7N610_9RHOB|nr:hypothetical protein [Palleronia aestuarii]PZX13727.1 hypothetical protein LX81_03060 [Palleronia aestuarii]